MKPFKFRMQTKLNITSREEQMAKEELQLRVRHRDLVQNQLEEIVERQFELEQSIKLIIIDGFCMDEFLLYRDYIPVLKGLRLEKEEELVKAEQDIELARVILMQKSRETQTLNKLKEKEWHVYLQEVLREEQKVIDEVAINGHYRNNLSN